MKTWKKLAAVGAVAALGFGLASCAPMASSDVNNHGTVVDESPDNNVYVQDSMLNESRFTLSDGRTVTCLALSWAGQGGLSCDWTNAE